MKSRTMVGPSLALVAVIAVAATSHGKNLAVRLLNFGTTWRDCSTNELIVAWGGGYEGSTLKCEATTSGASVVQPCNIGNPTAHRVRVRRGSTDYPSQSFNPSSGEQTTWTNIARATKAVTAYASGLTPADCDSPALEAVSQGSN